MTSKIKSCLYLGMFIALVFSCSDVYAISAWARRYNTDCSMCHWQVNKLNKFGQDFLNRGHRLPEEGAIEKDVYRSISDYISFTAKIRYKGSNRSVESFDNEAFSLYGGGPLSENFSFFYEQYLHESNTSGADREKLADAYVDYKSSGEEKYFKLRAGQISPYLMMTHGTGARLSITRPMILADVTVGSNPYRPRQRQYGVEGGYVMETTGLRGYLGIVNGTGHSPPNTPTDNNTYKDQYLTLEKVFSEGSNIGLYAYNGKYPFSTYNDSFYQLGLTGEFMRDKFSILGATLIGQNDKSTGGNQDSWGAFIEGDVKLPIEHLAAFARYDYWDPDSDTGNDTTKGPSIGVSYWLTTFARVSTEAQFKKASGVNTDSYWVELQFMY